MQNSCLAVPLNSAGFRSLAAKWYPALLWMSFGAGALDSQLSKVAFKEWVAMDPSRSGVGFAAFNFSP